MDKFTKKNLIKSNYAVLSTAMVFLALAGFQYYKIQHELIYWDRYFWQYYSMLLSSAILSLFIYLHGKNTAACLCMILLKAGIMLLMVYPINHLHISLTLLVPIFLEAGLYIHFPYSSAIMLFVLIFSGFLQKNRSVFFVYLERPAIEKQISYLFFAILTAALISLYYFSQKNLYNSYQHIMRLDETQERLSKVNLRFQSYTMTLEQETLKSERKRLSREIHDVVGYSLTNIRIMLEAAALMLHQKPDEVEYLIDKSMEEASLCLEQMRQVVRVLRTKEIGTVSGLASLSQNISVFSRITKIPVTLNFGNSKNSFGEDIDQVIFRFIQEGLTNSFRHGSATEISVYFHISNNILQVTIVDNGRNSDGIQKIGIGFTGMEERLSSLNGELDYQSLVNGFKTSMSIPISGKGWVS